MCFFVELKKEEARKEAFKIEDEKLVSEYYEYRQQLDQMASDFREVITHPTYCLPFLQPGRLVKVKHETLDFGWGVVINFQKRLPPKVSVSYVAYMDDSDRALLYRIGPPLNPTFHLMSNT